MQATSTGQQLRVGSADAHLVHGRDAGAAADHVDATALALRLVIEVYARCAVVEVADGALDLHKVAQLEALQYLQLNVTLCGQHVMPYA